MRTYATHTDISANAPHCSEIIIGKANKFVPRHGRAESTHRPPTAELVTGRKRSRAYALPRLCPLCKALIERCRTCFPRCLHHLREERASVSERSKSCALLGIERSEPCAAAVASRCTLPHRYKLYARSYSAAVRGMVFCFFVFF